MGTPKRRCKQGYLAGPSADLEANRPFQNFRYTYMDVSGKEAYLRVNGLPFFDDEGKFMGYRGTAIDETAEIVAQEKMEEARRRFINALDDAPVGIVLWDREDRFVRQNAQYKALRPEGSGFLFPGVTYEESIRTLAGMGEIEQAIGREEVWIVEHLKDHRVKPRDEEFRSRGKWYNLRDSLLPDGGTIVILSDITRQKELEADLRQAQKLETIGTLAGDIAHDLNNILTPMFGSIEFAMEGAPADGELRAELEVILKSAQRARDTVRQLLSFSRQEVQERQTVGMDALIGQALELFGTSKPGNIEIIRELDTACPPIHVNQNQLHQVILNLLLNAQYAMKDDGGKLSIHLDGCLLDEASAASHPGLAPGPHVCLSVSDTGTGMDAQTRERIFEPFFATEDVGEGTGLGLSTAHGIITAHGGIISVESEPGRGPSSRSSCRQWYKR